MSSFTVCPGEGDSPLKQKVTTTVELEPNYFYSAISYTFQVSNVARWAHGGAIWTFGCQIREGN
jgi:hypothetical protein